MDDLKFDQAISATSVSNLVQCSLSNDSIALAMATNSLLYPVVDQQTKAQNLAMLKMAENFSKSHFFRLAVDVRCVRWPDW